MIEVESQLREWGNSMGIIIPRETVLEEKLKPGDTVKIMFLKNKNPLKNTFGIIKIKRSTKELLKDLDKTGWDE